MNMKKKKPTNTHTQKKTSNHGKYFKLYELCIYKYKLQVTVEGKDPTHVIHKSSYQVFLLLGK